MADEGHFRLWNPGWCNSTTDLCIRTDVYGRRKTVFEIAVREAASAVAEIGTAADAAFDGTTTPELLYADSGSVTDTDTAAGAVRAVHVIGITVSSLAAFAQGEKPVYSVEEIRMNGTAAVISVRYYLRVMHAYATEWGTGGGSSHDAEGAIIITDATPTTYLTIDAAANESNNSGLIYVYTGYWGRWNRCYISLHDEDIDET